MCDVEILTQSLIFMSLQVRVKFKVPLTDKGDFKFILIDKYCQSNNPKTRTIN